MKTISGKRRSGGRLVRPTIALVVLAVLCVAAVAIVLSAKDGAKAAIPLRIDGEQVEAAEYLLLLENERAPTIAEYGERYGIEADGGAAFWTTVLDGSKPLDTAKRRALARLTRIKVQQRAAVSYGLLDSDSYASFLKRLEKENARRERLVATGGIVYGPIKYNVADYYDYSMSNLSNRLIEVMGPRLWPADDDTLLAYYDSVKDTRYRSDSSADLSFERIRDVVRSDYWSSRFQQWTDQAAAAAKIEIDENVYSKLGY
ncbi:hypothetical protein [Cohnella sp. GbtcB17]|uniref:hypothetical protein n=1 Tax=Cohnella sp. GbtcB17 TaxID=2824762 RepID=UPI001C30881E|nr:hypothetical protein [Cohnella sp. GbtcB17]